MKLLVALLTLTSVSIFSTYARASEALATANSERVEIPIHVLLTPSRGLEERNNVDVVLYGSLPNTCYAVADHEIERIDAHTIRVRQFAIHNIAGNCANEALLPKQQQGVVPFTQDVLIGRLPAGNYQFLYNKLNVGEQSRAVMVALNAPTTGRHYAEVSSVTVPERINGIDHLVATISGVLTSSCHSIDETIGLLREDDVFVLIPTIKITPAGMCLQVLIPFKKKVDLGLAKQPGIYLIQTRSRGNRDLNNVVNVMK